MVFVYITCKDKGEAKKISLFLLRKRLIACSNIFSAESFYWWNGKIIDDCEYVILAKTVEKNYLKIQEVVKKMHSYNIPCICKVNSKANKEFDEWVRKEVK
jgi:periplasmic divalent cation tolerance protein